MKKLRLYLRQYKNTVEMRVLEQEEIDRDLSEYVLVTNVPDLCNNSIYIRGIDYKCDHVITPMVFDTEEQASAYLEKVIGWLDEVFYPDDNGKELKRGDEVIVNFTDNSKGQRYFLADLGEDVLIGRYITAIYFIDGKYSGIEPYNEIIRIKKTGYDGKTDEYYGEIK